jgi:hypothetical protein
MPAFTRRQYAGAAAATTITAGINTTDTTCSLAATTGWPSTAGVPFYVVIDPGTSTEEKCSATISGTTLTLVRGQDDTSASSHSSGATIYPVFTANDADEANELVAKLTTKGDLLVTTGSALNRLAVGTNDYSLLADSSATNGVAWKQIPAAGIASDAVTTAKILDANVTAGKLASNAVETAKIADSNVTTAKIADSNVTTAKIADANVTGAKLANLTVSTKTGSYTLVAADRNTRVVMNSGSNTTITVNTSLFAAGDVVYIHNIGTGTCTVTAGTATVTTSGSLALAQWGGGTLYFTSASASIFFPYGGIGYGVATGTPSVSATYSDGGSSWKRIDFTSTNTLVVSTAGLFDLLLVGGGGGGGGAGGNPEGGGGAGAGILLTQTMYLPAATYTLTVGAGGAFGNPGATGGWSGVSTIQVQVAGGAGGPGPWGEGIFGANSSGASYRGGYGAYSGRASQQLYGFSSGGSDGSGNNGGGAGMGGAGGTRTAGAGVTSTFTGTSVTYAAGGTGGGSTGTLGAAGGANTGTGGSGSIGYGNGNNGGSGFISVRWKV